MTDDERDDLASAYLDGATTDEETARVEADPALLARVEELRRVHDLVAQSVPVPSAEAREAAIAAALAAADDANRPEAAAPATPVPVRRLPQRSQPARWLKVVATAAAVLVAVAILPLLAALSDNGGDDDMAATVSDAPEAADTGAETSDGGEAATEESLDDSGAGDDAGDGAPTASPTTTASPEALSQEMTETETPEETGPASEPQVGLDEDFANAASAPAQLYELGTARDADALAKRAERALRTDGAAFTVRRPTRPERRCLRAAADDDGEDLRLSASALLDDESVLVFVIRAQVRITRAAAAADGVACSDIARLDLPAG